MLSMIEHAFYRSIQEAAAGRSLSSRNKLLDSQKKQNI